jgi:hypothetical protein
MKPGDTEENSLLWRKSSRSNADCVELAPINGAVGVRDSKDARSVLTFGGNEWCRFMARVRRDEFNLD